jgi:hypothetical protein
MSNKMANDPSTSSAQKHLMAAAAHDPAFAKKAGVPVSVAKEFNRADQRKDAGDRSFQRIKAL